MARKSNKRKSANKQNRLLKKYSKGGFTKQEKKTIASKLGIKSSQARQLTKAYNKKAKLQTAATKKNNKSVFNINKNTNPSPSLTKGNKKSVFGINTPKKGGLKVTSTKSAPGVSKRPTPTPTPTPSPFPTFGGGGTKKPTPSIKEKVTPPRFTFTPPPSGPRPPRNNTPRVNESTVRPRPNIAPPPRLTPPTDLVTPPDPTDNNQRIDDAVDSVDTSNQQYQARIDQLSDQIAAQNDRSAENMNEILGMYNQSSSAYRDQIGGLQDRIGSFENRIGGYQTSIDDLRGQLNERSQAAKQFKLMDTQHLSNNTASGIRFRRSKKFKTGQFALGTAGLNRKNRSPLKISNVNL